MASIYKRNRRGGPFWLAFNHPCTGELLRRSLRVHDRTSAEKARRALEGACALIKDSQSLEALRSTTDICELIAAGIGLDKKPESGVEGGDKGEGDAGGLSKRNHPMASTYPRPGNSKDPTYYISFNQPLSGVLVRKSLQTKNKSHAERLRKRIEAMIVLRQTSALVIPDEIAELLAPGEGTLLMPSTPIRSQPAPQPERPTVETALRSLLAKIQEDGVEGKENHHLHCCLSTARVLFGSEIVEKVDPRSAAPIGDRRAKFRKPMIKCH